MSWLVSHAIAVFAFLLAVVALPSLVRSRSGPGASYGWLLAILLVPYVGIPAWLLFGGRKLHRLAARRRELLASRHSDRGPAVEPGTGLAGSLSRILTAAGAPPPRDGCSLTVLRNGEEAHGALVSLIEEARSSLVLSTYLVGDDPVGNDLLDRLRRRAEAGVEVRLLLDAFGSWGARSAALRALGRAGGRVARFMPFLHVPFRGRANLRNHRKLAVADGRLAFVGGMNLAREYLGPTAWEGRWTDLAVQFRGPAVTDLIDVFRSDWAFATGELLPDAAPSAAPEPDGRARLQVVASGPDVATDTLIDTLLTSVYEARERIWLATPYFVMDSALSQALELALRRGLDLRILVPGRSNHLLADLAGGAGLRRLEAAGARVFRHETMMHAKLVIVDESVALLGSANVDPRSLLLDFEVGVLAFGPSEVRALAGWLEPVMSRSSSEPARPGRLRRLGETVGAFIAPLV